MSDPRPEQLAALRAWLALEHEAVWTYGLLGARFTSLTAQAREAWTDHRRTRDALALRVRAAGGSPVRALGAYGVERPKDERAARSLAVDVEERISAACVALVGVGDAAGRRLALTALRSTALRAVDWGAAPDGFPGLSPT
ncbi:hypothetical protein ASD11_08275 [Aeromicrobium sp. Root495]|uniref:DUF4439 domain-containing protein n=1 Tax=Aeromicrobium sp. Root495 TaxID=1736550 RepID=UPI0006FE3EAD|nr:DUF4439 domain-containing protein [Aeromicrobium sp. Root495]KQY59544.1 hypothetical protein ASD11_08275 [Aeromicrobium sp. Root495]